MPDGKVRKKMLYVSGLARGKLLSCDVSLMLSEARRA